MFNEPGSQGQNKGRAGVLDERNNVLTTASAEASALRRLRTLIRCFYVSGFTGFNETSDSINLTVVGVSG